MVSDASVTLSWVTRDDTGPVSARGEVRYRAAAAGSESMAQDVRGAATAAQTHYVQITGLRPETSYTFTVDVDGKAASSGTFSTGRSLNPLAGEIDLSPLKIKGRVIHGGTPAAGAIVYLSLRHDTAPGGETSALLSAVTDGSGVFLLQSNFARTTAGAGWTADPAPGSNAIHIEAVAGDLGGFTADLGDQARVGRFLDIGSQPLH